MSEIIKKYASTHGNESKIRTVAFLVLVLTVVYLFTQWISVPAFLFVDFILRGFNWGKYSPLGFAADGIVDLLKFEVKPIFLAPKKFAAKIGALFTASLVILQLFGLDTLIVGSILAIFAALESLAGFCAGCHVYNFLITIKLIRPK